MSNKKKSYTLVMIQLSCIGIIAFTGPLFPENIIFLLIRIAGAVLRLWAIIVMELGRFNITPDVHKNSRLVINGPYKFIRHPIYSSVMLITLAWVLNYLTVLRVTIWIVPVIDLILKLKYEEKLLANRYKDYRDYQNKTKCLIPFIF